MIEQDLAGRVALVTGSTAGIGRVIAEALGVRGAALVAHGIEADRREEVVASWRTRGMRVLASDADLSQRGASFALVAAVEANLGPIDILILNASVELPQRLTELTADAVELQLTVNLTANVELLQACLPGMRNRGWGRLIAIGSVQEDRPNARHLIYAATKSALTNMMLNIARHDTTTGVTANVVRPGAILTDRNRMALSDRDYAHAVLSRIPAGRIGEPSDCVGIVSLLCSGAGSYINGATIAVDGGMRL